MILWNTLGGTKHRIVSLRSCWVLTCQLSPHTGRWLASGGLDNNVSLYSLPLPSAPSSSKNNNPQDYLEPPNITLTGHEGYISSIQFFNNDITCLSTSGDKSIQLWDIQQQQLQLHLFGHHGDVLTSHVDTPSSTASSSSSSSSAMDHPLIVTGSTDRSACVWDTRQRGGLIHSFSHEHDGDVNCVRFMPGTDSTCFATACDDGKIRLFDIRANAMLEVFKPISNFNSNNSVASPASPATPNSGLPSITSIDFAATGSMLLSACEDGSMSVWDVRHGVAVSTTHAHDAPVSAVRVASNGKAVVSASWDCLVKLWTQ